jgi:hypothetical protein
MKNEIRIRWQVEDGYVNNGPHSFTVRAEDIEEDMGENSLRSLFSALLQEEFEQNASAASDMEDEFVTWAQGVIAARAKE